MDMSLFTSPKALNSNKNIIMAEKEYSCGNEWAKKILRECAGAIWEKDSAKIQQLLWMMNELSSPYGDCEQKVGSYFLQALFCRVSSCGARWARAAAERAVSFEQARSLILGFQEASPWTTFGHAASNGAILEALSGEARLHIVDLGCSTLCTQWPTLLEALATRSDAETPSLRLTLVLAPHSPARPLLRDLSLRMAKFARLMAVPFVFRVAPDLSREALALQEGEALAVNCAGALRGVPVPHRPLLLRLLRSLNPRVLTLVEEEADLSTTAHHFLNCFDECFRFYTTYFDMLHHSFPTTSNHRLALERECSRSILRVLACDDDDPHDLLPDQQQQQQDDHDHAHDEHNNSPTTTNDSNIATTGDCERRERGIQWSEKLKQEAFSPFVFSDDVIDDVKALLKRYRTGWGLVLPQQDQQQYGAYLSWKDEPVVWASAWKP